MTGEETVELASAAGLFVDRSESLLATVHLTEVRHRLLRVNVYPGVLPGFARQFGAWAILSRDMKLSFGITHQWLHKGLCRRRPHGSRAFFGTTSRHFDGTRPGCTL